MSNQRKTLINKIIIKGKIEALTGIHIGGTNNQLSIGGMDNAIIRNPITLEPYIPGSSLKGKMRSLTELAHGTFGDRPMNRDVQNTPTNNPRHLAARLFGYTQHREKDSPFDPQQPSRVIVRDCALANVDLLADTLVEEKAETVIDRITSAAMPRQMERVPAGAQFSMEIIINVFTGEDEKEFVDGILRGLLLVKDDYLGGAGSRGSGQVDFEIGSITRRGMNYYTHGSKMEDNITLQYASNYQGLFKQ